MATNNFLADKMSHCSPDWHTTTTAGSHPAQRMVIGQPRIENDFNVDHNHNFPRKCVVCRTNNLNHEMDALYSGHSQTHLDSSKKNHPNILGNAHNCRQFSLSTCRQCDVLSYANQSVPNLNISGTNKVLQDPMLSSKINVSSQTIALSDQNLDHCSRLDNAFPCCCKGHQNEKQICNFNVINGDHSDKQSLMPSAPSITEWAEPQQVQKRQSEQNGLLVPKLHKQKITFSPFCLKVAGFISVVCNICLTAIIVYVLFYSKQTDPQPPTSGSNHPVSSYSNLDSAVCFLATKKLRFDRRSSFEWEVGHGTEFICRTDIKYLKWILILMQTIRNYHIYISSPPIGSQKRILNTAHARIFANCSKPGCPESKPLLLKDFQSCHSKCSGVTVDEAGIQIPVDGYFLVFSQVSYLSKNSLNEKLSVDIFQNSDILAKKSFPVSSGYGGVNMLFVAKLRQGDVLKPGISNTTLFYNFESLNFIGLIQLSPESHRND